MSLAVGIGLNTTVFSFYNALFMRPLPGVRHAESLVEVFTRFRNSPGFLPISLPNYRDLTHQVDSNFAALAASQITYVALGGQGEPERVSAALVSGNYFATLGVRPVVGRLLALRDDVPGAGRFVVLSAGLWHRKFAGAPNAVGRQVLLNRRSYTVIGVSEPGFAGTSSLVPVQLWVPLSSYREFSEATELMQLRGAQTLDVVGLLRPAVTPALAAQAVAAAGAGLARGFPEDNRDQSLTLMRLDEAKLHPNSRAVLRRGSVVLALSSGLLLLISCSNVASLFRVHLASRRGELALRASLGASRMAITLQLLMETLLAAVVAAALAIPLASLGGSLLWRYRPLFLPAEIMSHQLDTRVLAFDIAAMMVAWALSAVVPVLTQPQDELSRLLGMRSRAVGPSQGLRVGAATVVVQIALCFIALSFAAGMSDHLGHIASTSPGFDSSRLLSISVDLNSLSPDRAARGAFLDLLRQRVRSLPGAEDCALSGSRLFGRLDLLRNVEPAGAGGDGRLVPSGLVDAEYFRTTGIPLVAGRGFLPADCTGSAPIAIINQDLARRLWPAGRALGQWIHIDGEKAAIQVVGVSATVKHTSLDEPPVPFLYLPLGSRPATKVVVQVRAVRPAVLLPVVERSLHALDATLPLYEAQTLDESLADSLRWSRAVLCLLGLLSGLSLLLSAVGVFAVAAYAARMRRAEIGIRLALGAARGAIFGLVARQGLIAGLAGNALGIALAMASSRWARHWVVELEPLSGLWYGILGVGLLATVMMAVALPAIKASRLSSTRVLQEE